MSRVRLVLALVALVLGPMAAGAQTGGLSAGGFLVIDQEALFNRSLFGKRVVAEANAATDELVTENRKIEADLTAEEKALTDRRPTLVPDAFRKLADAFDEKVQRIRDEQESKTTAIGAGLEQGRRDFFQAVIPILADILREERAVAILDKRTVLLSINLIDVTDRAILRIDTQLGDGLKTEEKKPDQ